MIIVYINDIINDIIRIIYFTIKIHFMNDFKVNILLKSNIITFQKTIMNLKTRIIKFEKCQRL